VWRSYRRGTGLPGSNLTPGNPVLFTWGFRTRGDPVAPQARPPAAPPDDLLAAQHVATTGHPARLAGAHHSYCLTRHALRLAPAPGLSGFSYRLITTQLPGAGGLGHGSAGHGGSRTGPQLTRRTSRITRTGGGVSRSVLSLVQPHARTGHGPGRWRCAQRHRRDRLPLTGAASQARRRGGRPQTPTGASLPHRFRHRRKRRSGQRGRTGYPGLSASRDGLLRGAVGAAAARPRGGGDGAFGLDVLNVVQPPGVAAAARPRPVPRGRTASVLRVACAAEGPGPRGRVELVPVHGHPLNGNENSPEAASSIP
jgi:hypothetical protein